MERQDRESVLQKVVNRFKSAMRTVKAMPYLFLLAYVFCLAISCTRNIILISIVDVIYGASVWLCAFMLILSKRFGLCVWHKVACIIPMISLLVSVIDGFIFRFAYEDLVFINMSIIIFSVCYLIWSFFHFFVDEF